MTVSAAPGERSADSMLFILLVVGLLAVLGHWLVVRNQVGNVKEEVKTAQEEVDRLAPIIREVEEFKAKKLELERKVDVINTLKANQRGPVRIMDAVSKALPDLLWLRRMDVSGNVLKLTGQAFNANAVANFVENLDRVPEFSEPVLRDSQRRGEVVNFVIDINFALRPNPVDEDEGAVASGG